jgi:hypothetical protein
VNKGSCLCGAVRFEVAGDLPIHVADKSDYYEITDGLPQHEH